MSRSRYIAQKMPSGPRSMKRMWQRLDRRRERQRSRMLVRKAVGGDFDALPLPTATPKNLYQDHYW